MPNKLVIFCRFDKVQSSPTGQTTSEVRPLIDLSDPATLALGILGSGALGTLAFSLVASQSSSS